MTSSVLRLLAGHWWIVLWPISSSNTPFGRTGFANGGGSRWREEIGPKWIERVEADHGDIMTKLGYLGSNIVSLKNEEETVWIT